METVDDETSTRAIEWIREQHAAGKPWFCWWNGTRMHFRTHVKKELRGISVSDDGDLTALRYGDWKLIFLEQKTEETLRIWMEPFVPLRIPLIINLRRDPYERGMKTSNTYLDWLIDRAYLLVPAQAYVGRFLETFLIFGANMDQSARVSQLGHGRDRHHTAIRVPRKQPSSYRGLQVFKIPFWVEKAA